MGRDALLIEQFGNSDFSTAATPQRTEMTGRVLEMLFGLQIGLVCRNHGPEARQISIPLEAGGSRGDAVVYAEDGRETARRPLAVRDGVAQVEDAIPGRGCLVVELDPAPWEAAQEHWRLAGGGRFQLTAPHRPPRWSTRGSAFR